MKEHKIQMMYEDYNKVHALRTCVQADRSVSLSSIATYLVACKLIIGYPVIWVIAGYVFLQTEILGCPPIVLSLFVISE